MTLMLFLSACRKSIAPALWLFIVLRSDDLVSIFRGLIWRVMERISVGDGDEVIN
jgi:hypothetical protein